MEATSKTIASSISLTIVVPLSSTIAWGKASRFKEELHLFEVERFGVKNANYLKFHWMSSANFKIGTQQLTSLEDHGTYIQSTMQLKFKFSN
jgi:hypothetical protein